MKIGDRVVCMVSGVRGVITKIYTPTAAAMQIMVRTRRWAYVSCAIQHVEIGGVTGCG